MAQLRDSARGEGGQSLEGESASTLATRCARERAPSLRIALLTCLRTVLCVMWSSLAISGLVAPRATMPMTSRSRRDSAPPAEGSSAGGGGPPPEAGGGAQRDGGPPPP